jgi:hypothetical protein
MKLTRDYGNGIVVECEGANVRELWQQLAACDDAFSNTVCAAKIDDKVVKSDKVHFVYRVVDDNDYYEQVCVDNTPEGHKLKFYKRRFGQHKKHPTLYPKDSPADIPDGEIPGLAGWSKYVKPA